MENTDDRFAELAGGHLKSFRRTALRLLREERFDCILAPANSGCIMYALLKEWCRQERTPIPPAILAPVYTKYKFSERAPMPFDNALAAEAIRGEMQSLHGRTIKKFLFLDDEIGNGTAFAASWDAFRRAAGDAISKECVCSILAEENGFRSDYPLEGATTRFIPFAKRPSPDVSGIIYHAFPEVPVREFRAAFGEDHDIKEVLATLLRMPIKRLAGRKPVLTYGLLRMAEQHPRYAVWREEIIKTASREAARTAVQSND